jgi:hypothetical protein
VRCWFDPERFGFITPDEPIRTRSELHDKGRTNMASSGKKKTTMAKLTRESKLRERRLDKQARKDARKLQSAHQPDPHGDILNPATDDPAPPDGGQPALEIVGQAPAEG